MPSLLTYISASPIASKYDATLPHRINVGLNVALTFMAEAAKQEIRKHVFRHDIMDGSLEFSINVTEFADFEDTPIQFHVISTMNMFRLVLKGSGVPARSFCVITDNHKMSTVDSDRADGNPMRTSLSKSDRADIEKNLRAEPEDVGTDAFYDSVQAFLVGMAESFIEL